METMDRGSWAWDTLRSTSLRSRGLSSLTRRAGRRGHGRLPCGACPVQHVQYNRDGDVFLGVSAEVVG